jgi:hypothetical protein
MGLYGKNKNSLLWAFLGDSSFWSFLILVIFYSILDFGHFLADSLFWAFFILVILDFGHF